MLPLALLLFPLGVAFAAESSPGDEMPECAEACYQEYFSESGCDMDDAACQCDADFLVEVWPRMTMCLTKSCDYMDAAKGLDVIEEMCMEYLVTGGGPATKGTGEEKISTADDSPSSTSDDAPASTSDDDTPASTTDESAASTDKDDIGVFSTGGPQASMSQEDTMASATADSPIDDAEATNTGKASAEAVSSSNELSVGAKAGIGVGVAFGVVGMLCFGATLWLRKRKSNPQAASTPASMNPDEKQPQVVSTRLGFAEMDGRQIHQLPA